MSDATHCPIGSTASKVASALLFGCAILLLLGAATVMGWVAALDDLFAAWMGHLMSEEFTHRLPQAAIWLVAAILAFGLPGLLLGCRHAWQRLTIWLATLAVMTLWAPVLCLAGHRPDISAAWLAALASGVFVTLHLYWLIRKVSHTS